MSNKTIHEINRTYWDTYADEWFGVTALPQYGTLFVTENELHLFGDVKGAKLLEIGCGSGHSLKYHADNGAAELWGLDMSSKQLDNAKNYLRENKYTAKLICSPMEEECGIPKNYFDFVYSIYAIGWTTELENTFIKIASYLKKDGVFIFSWQHPLHSCVVVDENKLSFEKSYFDESWFTQPMIGESNALLCRRKISTYINALSKAGFIIDQMIEQTNSETLNAAGEISDKMKKAKMLPFSFVFKARKL
jgi:SAM-dependent methyltransferase